MADTCSIKSGSQPPSEVPSSPAKSSKKDFWLAVVECTEGNPKINFDKLAEKCNYKNATTARVIYGQKRKHINQSNNVEASPTTGGAKRGRKPKGGSSDDVDGETVKKGGRKPKDTATDKPAKKRGRPAKKEIPAPPPKVSSSDEGLKAEEQDTEVESEHE